MDMLDEVLARRQAQRDLPSPPRRREVRERNGLSQADLAAVLNEERSTITRWEAGTRTPRGDGAERYVAVLRRLARELGEDL